MAKISVPSPVPEDSQPPKGDPWPLGLMKHHGLRRSRGEVVDVGETPHAIVGFDGKDMGYLCWITDERGNFDTSKVAFVDLKKAQCLPRNRRLEEKVPMLPPIDHMGRIEGMPRSVPARRSLGRNTMDESPLRQRVNANEAPATSTTRLGNAPPQWTSASSCGSGAATMARAATSNVATTGTSSNSGTQAPEIAFARGLHLDEPERIRRCILCVLCRRLTSTARQAIQSIFVCFLGWGPDLPPHREPEQTPEQQPFLQRALDYRPAQRHDESGENVGSAGATVGQRTLPATPASSPTTKARNTRPENLQITVPIVKPPTWQEVQSLVQRMPLVFDERGSRETMTVKPCNWPSFVERQKERLAKQIDAARNPNADGSSDTPSNTEAEQLDDQDIAELERVIDSMDDWKDLSRYQGKSISMASTRRGNEMKLHVMAFAEREDGSIDFMRVHYTKSVQLRNRAEWRLREPSMLGNLQTALGFLRPIDSTPEEEERWLNLLKQPDLAKYTIALAYKDALQEDGVNLQFSEATFADN